MAATKSAAARSAAAESSTQPKKIDALGISLEGPPTLPGTFAFDLLEASGADDPGGMLALFKSILGPDQWLSVRDALAEDETGDGGFSAIAELLEAILEAYGITEGE